MMPSKNTLFLIAFFFFHFNLPICKAQNSEIIWDKIQKVRKLPVLLPYLFLLLLLLLRFFSYSLSLNFSHCYLSCSVSYTLFFNDSCRKNTSLLVSTIPWYLLRVFVCCTGFRLWLIDHCLWVRFLQNTQTSGFVLNKGTRRKWQVFLFFMKRRSNNLSD